MKEQITAAVIGAGRFGKNYLHCLADLNRRSDLTVPNISKLIITKTRRRAASQLAVDTRNQYNTLFSQVVGAEVKNRRQLKTLLTAHRPELICIAARDKHAGDAIHAEYAEEAVGYGTVLCEKPFSRPTGGMDDIGVLKELIEKCPPGNFGLELPMAVVAGDLMRDPRINTAFIKSERVEFIWERPEKGGPPLIDDMAIHPWSLIPATFKAEVLRVVEKGFEIEIITKLLPEKGGNEKECRILLRTGGHFRGMVFDRWSLRFVNVGRDVHILQTGGGMDGQDHDRHKAGTLLFKVENPLKQQLVAVLKNMPVVDMNRTYASQFFLERLVSVS